MTGALTSSVLISAALVSFGLAQAAPTSFHTAVGTLSKMIFVQQTGADTYLVSETVLVQYDEALPGIRATKTSPPLEDQGVSVATRLIPSWCGLDIQYLHVKYLTEQMARSARLQTMVRYRLGRCEVRSLSAGMKSFIVLRPVPGALVWPPRLVQ